MYFQYEIAGLLLHSSAVEEIRRENGKIEISHPPHRGYLDTKDLKVMIVKAVTAKGTLARYNRSENILFFADQAHQTTCLCRWGLPTDFFDQYIIHVKEIQKGEYDFSFLEETIKPALPQIPYNELLPRPINLGMAARFEGGKTSNQLGIQTPRRTSVQLGALFCGENCFTVMVRFSNHDAHPS